ncbi:uncharacterized protein LOC126749890 [Anthonomus grandis grandis]|uniref:uncharacterized protein LOC126749890 n=1 Tax=Anthonomus grandis grandis TaxID=2921223 RepID=UPI0021657417|nr:uncharacterized protein LOC126749890 [Anthonomus grandis grandis]
MMDLLEEITDESDHEQQQQQQQESPRGYYTRAKRRRLSEQFPQDREDASSSSSSYRVPEVSKRKNPIMFVPTEVLQSIFKHLTYHELSSKVRLVNRRFKIVAEDLLNLGYKRIQRKFRALIASTEVALRCIEDDMETKCIARLLSLLEVLNLQYAVVLSTIWRYVYNDLYKCKSTCMYAGLIIDTHEAFFWKFVHCPNQLYSPAVIKEYTYPPEVTKIIQMIFY